MKVLVLSPHTDDEVLGAGGSIARWVDEGHTVVGHAFTACNMHQLASEYMAACDSLLMNWGLGGATVREFQKDRQQILDIMIELNQSMRPDLVLCPSKNDIHQDHQVITQESLRAFKHCSILGYELPWNNYAFESDYFVRLEEKHVERKLQAMRCYESQQHRAYFNEEYMKSHLRVRGIQVKSPYAETFQLIRWIH